MAERKTIVYPNPEVLAQAVAARTLLTIIDLLAEPDRQRVDIAVTGGTDGIYVLKVMGESPLADAVDWRRVHVWWGDERFVAADDDDRNAKQAREAWFGKLIEDGLMPAGNIHEMPADGRDADEIASASPEQTDAVLAEAFIERIRRMHRSMGISEELAMLRKEDVPALTARALKEGNPNYPVPVIWEEEQMRVFLMEQVPK